MFGGKNVTITSTNPDDPAVTTQTIIDGGGTDSTVRFSGTEAETCLLTGITITGGVAQHTDTPLGIRAYGGGIVGGTYETHTNATVTKCVLTGNQAEWGGGVAFFSGTIQYCIIENNTFISKLINIRAYIFIVSIYPKGFCLQCIQCDEKDIGSWIGL